MPDLQVPVVVWGGGTGGVAAAIQAARRGAHTLLLTPGPWLGGMVSAAGVCAPDGNELSPWQTGLWGAFLRGLAAAEPTGLDHNWVSCFGYRPTTAEALLRGWVADLPRLDWWPDCRLLGVARRGDRVTGITLERQGMACRVDPQLVIDGSDRGELIAMAGAGHRLGWEAREEWQEPSAPPRRELETNPFFAEQPVQSPTWVAMGQLGGDQLPARSAALSEPLPEPFQQAAAAFGLERTITYGRLPGNLVMLNWPLHGNDWHRGLGRAFAMDDPQAEQELFQQMQAHSLAFGRALSEASSGWLQLAEVFPCLDSRNAALTGASPLALMPYWREGRRLLGLSTVVETDLLPVRQGEATIAPLPRRDGLVDAVAVGNYANDHHYPGGDWPLAPKSCRWGGRWSGTPFSIPYGALVSADTSNLLAADKCLSVSHMANGATRLQPLVLNIGQAAGLAAALCLERACAPAELPVTALQEALITEPQAPAAPFPLWDTPWHHPHWRERQLACLADPARLSDRGLLDLPQAGSAPAVLPPPERFERSYRGVFGSDGHGTYQLHTQEGSWPLISLEPAVAHWLANQVHGMEVGLVGVANPWGPWLRVTRV
jgi:hypothetical protein